MTIHDDGNADASTTGSPDDIAVRAWPVVGVTDASADPRVEHNLKGTRAISFDVVVNHLVRDGADRWLADIYVPLADTWFCHVSLRGNDQDAAYRSVRDLFHIVLR